MHATHDLVEAAFDKGEARHFLNSKGYDPGFEDPFRDTQLDPYKYFIQPRLKRLDELIVRANSLEVNPDFDPRSAAKFIKNSTAERLRLEAAVEQRNEQNKRVTTERDAFASESRQFKAELDGQIRGRCIEVADELSGFLTLNRAMPPRKPCTSTKGRLGAKLTDCVQT